MPKRPAFTILELLIVLAIISILLSLIVLQGQSALDTKRQTQISADLYRIAQASRLHLRDQGELESIQVKDLRQLGYLKGDSSSPVADYDYVIRIRDQEPRIEVTLEKKGAVYETENFQARLRV